MKAGEIAGLIVLALLVFFASALGAGAFYLLLRLFG